MINVGFFSLSLSPPPPTPFKANTLDAANKPINKKQTKTKHQKDLSCS